MLFEGGFTFRNFVADAFAIFMFVLWFWLFVSVASDLFRRHDVSGWAKVLWVIALLLFSYIVSEFLLTSSRKARAWLSAIKRERNRSATICAKPSVSALLTRSRSWID